MEPRVERDGLSSLMDTMSNEGATPKRKAARIFVEGIVQGVGFRPFVYRLAKSLGLKGWVLNSTRGVEIEVEGPESALMEFYREISLRSPVAASILSKEIYFHDPKGYSSFIIRDSVEEDLRTALVSPDIATCEDCVREMLDPYDRRYMYPFINCTNCGPRFTIIESIPYDRSRTSMRKFTMCSKCAYEYSNAEDRRYHAQPNACHDCGPSYFLVSRDGSVLSRDPIDKAVELLASGHILAIKGIGGFHLVCDAENSSAVERLRLRKAREMKPFAIMSPNVETVMSFCEVSDEERELLESPKRPIVLLRKARGCFIADSVAPRSNNLGVMLPYAPLHYILFKPPLRALVMTSGNISDEPIVIDNDEALKDLSGLADFFLMHDRDIVSRCDDSVVRVIGGRACILRRSRGYVPYPIRLHFRLKDSLSCGGELKNTFCLAKDDRAILSQHIGDLKTSSTFNYYKDSIKHFEALFSIDPEIIVHDLHPEYLSTKYALSRKGKHVGVQHHHAHVASCMAENAVRSEVIGVALDGAGYGADGRVWGFEFFLTGYSKFERIGHLRYVPLPGGDSATREPYRMAISYLYASYGSGFEKLQVCRRWDQEKIELLTRMIQREVNSPLTSSAGRFFDAASSIIGVCDVSTYEGEAAMELEAIALDRDLETYPFDIRTIRDGTFELDPRRTIISLVEEIQRGAPRTIVAGRFHRTVAELILNGCLLSAQETGIKEVAISGGVFQNKLLTERVQRLLEREGFLCYLHRVVPPNDGGISLGQAAVATFKVDEG
ncbi:MAG: carbamoyltransferase HypF [Thermoproteota archaeon]